MFGLVDDIDSVTNVQFLLSDNGISRISSISFNSRQRFCLLSFFLSIDTESIKFRSSSQVWWVAKF